MTELESFSLSDRGRRQNNEDFTAFYEPTDAAERAEKGCLYVVADGVGGAARGERASQFAAEKLLYEYYQGPVGADPAERLQHIMHKANEDLYLHAESNGIRMATTIVAAVIRNGLLHVANVGDSRAYLIRAGECRQLNRDHSIVGEMVATGEMTEAEAMSSKVKNRLTRSLGGEPEVQAETYPPVALQAGDKVLLCTDGLTRYASHEDLYRLAAEGSLPEIGQRLVTFANDHGGVDNVSVVLICYQGASVVSPVLVAEPAEAELDAAPTQPDFTPPSASRRQWQPALVALPAVAVLVLALVAVGFGRNWSTWRVLFPGIMASPTVTATQTAPATSRPSPSVESDAPLPAPTDTLMPLATSLPSPAATASATGGPVPGSFVCVRKVEQKPQLGTLSGVLAATGASYDSRRPYSQCILDAAQAGCTSFKQIQNPPAIVVPGMWIVVPDVDQTVCVPKGGKWVPVVTSNP